MTLRTSLLLSILGLASVAAAKEPDCNEAFFQQDLLLPEAIEPNALDDLQIFTSGGIPYLDRTARHILSAKNYESAIEAGQKFSRLEKSTSFLAKVRRLLAAAPPSENTDTFTEGQGDAVHWRRDNVELVASMSADLTLMHKRNPIETESFLQFWFTRLAGWHAGVLDAFKAMKHGRDFSRLKKQANRSFRQLLEDYRGAYFNLLEDASTNYKQIADAILRQEGIAVLKQDGQGSVISPVGDQYLNHLAAMLKERLGLDFVIVPSYLGSHGIEVVDGELLMSAITFVRMHVYSGQRFNLEEDWVKALFVYENTATKATYEYRALWVVTSANDLPYADEITLGPLQESLLTIMQIKTLAEKILHFKGYSTVDYEGTDERNFLYKWADRLSWHLASYAYQLREMEDVYERLAKNNRYAFKGKVLVSAFNDLEYQAVHLEQLEADEARDQLLLFNAKLSFVDYRDLVSESFAHRFKFLQDPDYIGHELSRRFNKQLHDRDNVDLALVKRIGAAAEAYLLKFEPQSLSQLGSLRR